MTYRAIAFDIDGTLYSSFFFYLRNLGFALRHGRNLKAFSRVRYELHERSMDPALRPGMPRDLEGFRGLQASLLAKDTGMAEVEARRWAERVMYGELEDSFAHVRPYPGVWAALDALAAAGFRLAALSDFPAPNKLEKLGLARRFEVALSSEESGFLKPAPEPFLLLAARLGLEPGEIFYVGNSRRLDIVGAKGAGMGAAFRGSSGVTAGIREPYAPKGLGEASLSVPDFSFTDWSRLVAFILGRGSPGPGTGDSPSAS